MKSTREAKEAIVARAQFYLRSADRRIEQAIEKYTYHRNLAELLASKPTSLEHELIKTMLMYRDIIATEVHHIHKLSERVKFNWLPSTISSLFKIKFQVFSDVSQTVIKSIIHNMNRLNEFSKKLSEL